MRNIRQPRNGRWFKRIGRRRDCEPDAWLHMNAGQLAVGPKDIGVLHLLEVSQAMEIDVRL